jgi:1D-myo-inositol-tetrakisphosphate 5-kinase/inositol-polyphosphate multikinase
VAGHDGVQQLASGLIFKPSKNAEVAFYASLSRLPSTLLPFLPLHHGSLPLPVPHPEKQEERGLVLENLTLPFKRANVLDVKLGTQLWDEGASEEKRERMQKQSRESTSGSDGLRLTGWRVSGCLSLCVPCSPERER